MPTPPSCSSGSMTRGRTSSTASKTTSTFTAASSTDSSRSTRPAGPWALGGTATSGPATPRHHLQEREDVMLKTILLRRLVGGIFILWLVSVLVFAAIHLLPGNAATILVGHSDTTPQEVASLSRQLGLDQPLIAQYGRWIKGLVTGNWGTSLVSSLPVSYLVRTRLENSGALTLISMLMLSPLAVIIGTVSAIRRNRAVDHVTSLVTLCLSAVPAFAIGVMVIYLFATNVVHW